MSAKDSLADAEPCWLARSVDVIIFGEETQVRFLHPARRSVLITVDSHTSEAFFTAAVHEGVGEAQGHAESWLELLRLGRSTGFLVTERRIAGAGVSIPCFTPIKIKPGQFVIRVDRTIYSFPALKDDDVGGAMENLARFWVSAEDRNVIIQMLQQPSQLTLVPSALFLDCSLIAEPISQTLPFEASLLEVSGDQKFLQTGRKVSSVQRDFAGKDDYWEGLITWASDSCLLSLLDPLVGGQPPFRLSRSAYRASHPLHQLSNEKVQFSFGTGESDIEAAGKATMEAIERYFSQSEIPTDVFASEDYLKTEGMLYVPASIFLQHSTPQKANATFRENFAECHASTKIHWCYASALGDGSDVLVPHDVVTYGPRSDNHFGRTIFQSNSSGCAGRRTLEDAVLCGARELIERDALLLWWLNRVTPPRLDPSLCDAGYRETTDLMSQLGYEFVALDLSLDSLPVVLAVCRRLDGQWPYFFCGAGCDLELNSALAKAIDELKLACWTWIGAPGMEPPKVEQIKDPLDHELWYLAPEHRHGVDFFFEESRVKPAEYIGFSQAGALDEIQNRLGQVLYYVFVDKKVTNDASVVVARTLIPSLLPITFGYMSDYFAHERIFKMRRHERFRHIQNFGSAEYLPHFFP